MESEDARMAPKPNEIQERLKKKLMGSSVLDSFAKLSSNKEKIRIDAGIKLLNNLNFNATNEQENNYTLDRLIRGVGSSRTNAKTGYYSVLVALLTKFPFVTVNNVLESIKKHLSVGGSNSKSENADISMGQILVCGALIHSGLYVKATPDEQKTILAMLITAGNKRSYLSLASCTFLAELIEKLDDLQFKIVWDSVKENILKPWTEQNLDSIYFLSAARAKFPSIVKSKTINKTLNAPEIVHEDSLKHLCNILLNIPSLKSLKHPVYQNIAKQIQAKSLVKEWCTEMDKQIQKTNRNKVLIITKFLIEFLENTTDSTIIPSMLTNHYVVAFVHTLKNSRPRDRDDELVNKMDVFFKSLTKNLETDGVSDKTKIAVMKKLLFYPGTFIFEKITRTKIIQYITSNLSEDGVKTLARLYKEVVVAKKLKVVSETDQENWINSDRIYAAQLLVKLLAHSAVQKSVEWRLDQLKFLVNIGFFKDNEDTSSIGAELAAALKDCFYHSLDQRLPKLEDLRNVLSALVHYINENVFVNATHQLRHPLTEDGMDCWSEMMQLVSKLEGTTKLKHKYAVPVFHTLFLHMGLQLFSDLEMAQNALKELHSCFSRLEMETPSRKKKHEAQEECEPVWIEVVVDLFLSFLSQNSHLLRSIINCVFPYLCPHLTMTAVRQILDVLNPKNKHPLTKNEDDSDLSDEELDEEEVENEDEESETAENEIEEEDESDDSGLEEEDLDNEEETKTDRLRMAVRDALHQTGYQTDDESEDIDDLNEEDGNKLDEALAEAFKAIKKNNKGKSNKQSKNEKILTHFRVRVLDLVDIYLDSEPSMIQCLEIMCLLLQTLEFSIRDVHQKPLEHRVRSCLRKVSTMKKFSSTEETTEEILANMLNSFLDKGSKTSFIYQDMGDMIAECCMFIVRCSQILSNETSATKVQSKITHIFKNALETFFNKRDSLLPLPLFKNVLQLSWEGNWYLVPLLVNYAFKNDIRPFRRSQALDLLNIFYCNSRYRTLNPEQFKNNIALLEKQLSVKALELLQNLSANTKESKIKEKFVCLLLTLLSSVKMAKNSEDIDWKTIGEAVREYRSRVTLAKDAKLAYNKFCRVLGISNLVKMQLANTLNGHEDSDSDNESQSDKHKEKKRTKAKSSKKDAHKLKKEAQLLRLKASSEGLTDEVAFSNVDLAQIKNDLVEDDALESDEPKKKKHIQENGLNNKLKGKSKKNKPQLNGNISSDEEEQIKEKINKQKKTKEPKNKVMPNGEQSNLTFTKQNKKRHNSESEDRPTNKKTKIV